MNLFKLFLNGFLSVLTIFLMFGTLYFFWATESNVSYIDISIYNLIIYKYQSSPPGFSFGNGTILISIVAGLLNILFLKLIPKNKN